MSKSDLASGVAPARHAEKVPPVQSPRSHRNRRSRLGGGIVVLIGCFVLVLAALLPLYAYPRVAQLPDDPQDGTTLRATGATMLVPDLKSPTGATVLQDAKVQVSTFASGVPDAAYGDSVAWEIASRTSVEGHGLISAQVERFSLDRKTAEPTNCCGDRLVTTAEDTQGVPLTHHGYTVWPFDVQKHSYQLWDVTLRHSKTANFTGVETRLGVRTNVYRSTVPLQAVGTTELPGSFFGSSAPSVKATSQYADVSTYWIAPATGGVIGLREETTQQFTYGGHTVTAFKANLVMDAPTASRLADYKRGALVLPLLRGRASWVLVVIGIGLVVLGAWLMSSRRRPRPAPAAS